MMDKHFCTCIDTKCADHPTNHSDGCDPCIRKNLGLGEIPYCFWANVSQITGKSDYSAQKFADFVLNAGAEAKNNTRQRLAQVAKTEAQRFFHGRVMKTEHNIHDIIGHFPGFEIEEADKMWCAAFVYYCCIKAGYAIPIRPKECRSCHLAGCLAWEEWAIGDKRLTYAAATSDFVPEAGDIVLFDNVCIDHAHDHIGIVIENKEASIIVAEGNINNVSGLIEREKDAHIRAYIRMPDDYEYNC